MLYKDGANRMQWSLLQIAEVPPILYKDTRKNRGKAAVGGF